MAALPSSVVCRLSDPMNPLPRGSSSWLGPLNASNIDAVGTPNSAAAPRIVWESASQTWVEKFHPWWGTEGESLETYAAYLSKEPETTEKSS